jgi:aquaporin Z
LFLLVGNNLVLGISIAFGFTVVAMAYAIGVISGCHINPAVTIGVLTAGKMTVQDTIGYIIAQCLVAILRTAVLYLIASGPPGIYHAGMGGSAPTDGVMDSLEITIPSALL